VVAAAFVVRVAAAAFGCLPGPLDGGHPLVAARAEEIVCSAALQVRHVGLEVFDFFAQLGCQLAVLGVLAYTSTAAIVRGSRAIFHGSTSMSQSMSVETFHCDVFAFSYSFTYSPADAFHEKSFAMPFF